MRLLVSVLDKSEALDAAMGGADVVDVKNPREGALGAQPPSVIREIAQSLSGFRNCEVSATIGDLPNLPGTASLAALGAAVAGAGYIKAGLYGLSSKEEAVALLTPLVEAVQSYDASRKAIAAGYADFSSIGSLPPHSLPLVAAKAGCYGILVDVHGKASGNLFDYCSVDELRGLVHQAHDLGLNVALAGGLREDNIPEILSLEPNVIGVRRAVCNRADWVGGKLDRRLVASFKRAVERAG